MRKKELTLYLEAQKLSALAMGKDAVQKDPLAWWCLTEILVNFAKKHKG